MNPHRDPDIAPDDEPEPVPWRELARRLLVFARGLGASVEEAEDVVQDALQHVAAHPDWHDPERGALTTVLRAVIRNAWANRLRHHDVRRRARPALELVTPRTPPPDHPIGAGQASDNRRQVLGLLEPEERAVFEAWLRQRARLLDARGAARELALSVPAYEAAKKRLRRRIRAALQQLDLTPADLFDPPEPP